SGTQRSVWRRAVWSVFIYLGWRWRTLCYPVWSLDVCSSDLRWSDVVKTADTESSVGFDFGGLDDIRPTVCIGLEPSLGFGSGARSEERRAGKEGRCRRTTRQTCKK